MALHAGEEPLQEEICIHPIFIQLPPVFVLEGLDFALLLLPQAISGGTHVI